ncbi:MAG: ABC transporter permease [Gemmatimonadetes bacterium]|jgi:peptide/nickel transport system permease protein|nr:ABC transporter permease [Gemmatimonadota bacterium]MBT7864335.1 ABC transporter permease [Gemmatimonadota bacterium]
MNHLAAFWLYVRRAPQLAIGLWMLLFLVLFGLVGPLLIDTEMARPLAAVPRLAPSAQHPFGTDDAGRDLLAVMVVGVPLTLRIGFVAGSVGLSIGAILGLLAGFVGGRTDGFIRGIVDTLLTVPGLLVLISVASSIREEISVEIMALVVASLSWMWPTRTIRAQVLSLRERAFVQMARLNGQGTLEIIVREVLPNLLPYLAASFALAVSSAILATISLEALGLGPQNEPTVGMTIYWAITFSALLRGMWWWWAIPIAFLILLFVGLLLVAAGLDNLANPKSRRAT